MTISLNLISCLYWQTEYFIFILMAIPVQGVARLSAADALAVDEEVVLCAADGGLDAEGDKVEAEVADVLAREADGVGAAVVVEVGRGEVGAVDGDGGGGDVGPRAERRPGVNYNLEFVICDS